VTTTANLPPPLAETTPAGVFTTNVRGACVRLGATVCVLVPRV
jgi:hypothetical protein